MIITDPRELVGNCIHCGSLSAATTRYYIHHDCPNSTWMHQACALRYAMRKLLHEIAHQSPVACVVGPTVVLDLKVGENRCPVYVTITPTSEIQQSGDALYVYSGPWLAYMGGYDRYPWTHHHNNLVTLFEVMRPVLMQEIAHWDSTHLYTELKRKAAEEQLTAIPTERAPRGIRLR